MSLNIQTATGLLEIGGNVTKEKVISALGYEPANEEVETTVENHVNDTDAHVTSDERTLWNKNIENLDSHKSDKTIHVTSEEKQTWNNKSDFSGAYADLLDAPSITENDSGNMIVADENGNIIMQVDENGLETTNVITKTIELDGEDLGVRLDELEANMVSNIVEDESGKVEFADEAGNVIARINADGFETTQVIADTVVVNGVNVEENLAQVNERIDNISVPSIEGLATETYVDEAVANLVNSAPEALNTLDELAAALGDDANFATTVTNQIASKANQTSLDSHTSNTTVHVTADERTAWNNKSNFSGDYNDLTNAPSITEDNNGSVVYADESGNIIAKIDANGFETTVVTAKSVTINGTNVETALVEKADVGHTHEQYLEASDISGKADKTYVDDELAKKSDSTHTHDEYLEADDIVNKADISYVDDVASNIQEQLDLKADHIDVVKENITLLASAWTGDTAPFVQSVTISDHDNTTDLVDLMISDVVVAEEIEALQAANILHAKWVDNTTLQFSAYGEKPTIDINCVALVGMSEKMFVDTSPVSHASSHAIGGSDPITPEMIGATPSVDHQIKTYTSLEQLGLNGVVTLDDVIENMLNGSYVSVKNSISNPTYVSECPDGYGTLTIAKQDTNYIYAKFVVATDGVNEIYYNYYHSSSGWSGWTTHFLPLDGSSYMTGNLSIAKNAPTIWLTNQNDTYDNQALIQMYTNSLSLYSRNVNGNNDNQRAIMIGNSAGITLNGAVRLADKVDGTTTYYKLYGDHNITDMVKKTFTSNTTSPMYIPTFGSGYESRGYCTLDTLLSSMGGGKCEVKSYVGTGTYGSSDPNSLTFSFAPKIVMFVACVTTASNGNRTISYQLVDDAAGNIVMLPNELTTSYKIYLGFTSASSDSKCYGKKSSDGKTIYWYDTNNASSQLNNSGITYYFFAIG